MALVVEDGTVVPEAEALCSVEFADAHFDKRGNTAWLDLDESVKEAALRRATDYLEDVYGPRFQGARVSAAQALSWPRKGVTLSTADSVPSRVQRACAELAAKAVAGELLADIGRQTLSETVGELSVTYDPAGPRSTQYAAVQAMLAPLLGHAAGSATVRLTRV